MDKRWIKKKTMFETLAAMCVRENLFKDHLFESLLPLYVESVNYITRIYINVLFGLPILSFTPLKWKVSIHQTETMYLVVQFASNNGYFWKVIMIFRDKCQPEIPRTEQQLCPLTRKCPTMKVIDRKIRHGVDFVI